jgi:hypothetical protein
VPVLEKRTIRLNASALTIQQYVTNRPIPEKQGMIPTQRISASDTTVHTLRTGQYQKSRGLRSSLSPPIGVVARLFHYGAIVTNYCWTSTMAESDPKLHSSRHQPAQTTKICPIQCIMIVVSAHIIFPSNVWIIPRRWSPSCLYYSE